MAQGWWCPHESAALLRAAQVALLQAAQAKLVCMQNVDAYTPPDMTSATEPGALPPVKSWDTRKANPASANRTAAGALRRLVWGRGPMPVSQGRRCRFGPAQRTALCGEARVGAPEQGAGALAHLAVRSW